ncbi:MAG: hypothetical protein H6841_09090 [Planctomycetes bacterium]|nr:hypothetical protein [Planctomycetota bacterium]MCB9934878.1 hypothetical protein [Planctomycetota bacterium]
MEARFTALDAALQEFLQTRELEEGRELPPEAPSLEDRRAQLNAAFWKTARELVSAVVSGPGDEIDDLTPEQLRLLDYGLIPGVEPGEVAVRLLPGETVEGVLLLHQSLQDVLDDVRRRDTIRELRQDLDALSRDIELWPETHLVHTRYRDARVVELLGETPHGTHVLRLLGEIDEKLEPYKRLQAREREASSMTADERRAWSTLRHFVDSRREQIAGALSPLGGTPDAARSTLAGFVLAAMEAVDESVGHLLQLHARRRGLEQQVMEQESAARRVTVVETRKALLRELDAVAGLLRLAARYAHVTECAVPVDEHVEYIDPGVAADAMEHILQFDPRLIDNPQSARFGLPELLLAPGIGDGVFDARRNRWVVPQRCVGGAIASLAHGAVMYRLEVDAGELNKALLASYRESIPANRGIRANLKLRNGLIRDYVNWMTREAFGEEVLSRETREWFERHVAPNKEQPWIPANLRGCSEHRLNQFKRELACGARGAESEYEAGVTEWLLSPRDAESIREKALPCLMRAVELDPGHRAATWSLATLHMQLGEYQQAIDRFRRFTEISPKSWWTLKAIELCARCR